MSMGAVYGGNALRRQQEARRAAPECQPSLLDHVPPDAPMDDATLAVWNGKRFVTYDSWLATSAIQRDKEPGNRNVPTTQS